MVKKMYKLVLLWLLVLSGHAQAQEPEARVKAVFLYNFTKYMDWDSTMLPKDFVIAVIGSSPVKDELISIARTYTVNGKKIVLKDFEKPADIDFCELLFIPKSCGFPLADILEHVKKGTITVSEQPGYASKGTSFNFVITNGKVKFQANLHSITASGTRVSSQLLKLAELVK